ncbi:MAG: tetratricopeptide repeat protein [Pirellulaceae bacterium]
MRTFNLRLVLWLAGILMVVAVSMHYLHRYQVRRNAGVYLTLATEKDAVARDETVAGPERLKAAEAALQHYRRYLALDPLNLQARAAYGKLLFAAGDLPKAYFQFERVLRTGPNDPADEEEVQQLQKLQDEIRRMQVVVAMNVQRYSDAIVHLQPLLDQAGGKDSILLEQLAVCENESGKYEDASKTLDAAIANAPTQLSAYRRKMDLQRSRLKDWASARETLGGMIAANPQNADALLLHAEYLLSDKDANEKDSSARDQRLAKATQDCADALTLEPENVGGLVLAAECARHSALRARQNAVSARQQNKADEASELSKQASELFRQARELLRKSIAIKSDIPQLYLQLANIELLANDEDRAKALDVAKDTIREGIAAIPDKTRNADLRWQLANWLIGSSKDNAPNAKELQGIMAELKKELPDSAAVTFLEAKQLLEDQKWSEARRVLETVRPGLSQQPELQMQADMLIALCSQRLGDNDLWLTAVRQKLDANPLDVAARRDYADALLNVGRWLEALREYDQLAGRLGAQMPLDMAKQYFLLKRGAILQQPRASRNWAPLTAMLDQVEATAPTDPWVPIMRAELALTIENSEEPPKVAATPEGNQVAEQTPVPAKEVAKKILEAACLKTPNEQTLWMARLDLALQQKDSEEVARLLSEMEKNFGDTVDVRLAKARVLVDQKGKEAVPELAAFAANLDQITSPSDRYQLYSQLTRLCMSAGSPAQGLVYGRQAAKLAPNSLQIRMFLLQVARSAQDVKAAEQIAAEIEKLEQGGAVTLFSQAVCELTRYAFEQARAAEKSKTPQDAAAMAEAREAKQMADEALQAARNKLLQAAQKRPNWPQVPVLLGTIVELQKKETDSTAELQEKENDVLAYFMRAIDLGTRDAAIVMRVASILVRGGQRDLADEVVRKSEEQGGVESLDIAFLASRIAASREDYDRALEKVEIPIAAGARSADVFLFKGRLLAIRGDLDGARKSIQEAIDVDPKDDVAYLVMVELLANEAKALELADKKDEATAKRAEAENVLAAATQNVAPEKLAQTIALCRDLLGQTEEAVKLFDTAVEQSPNDPGLLLAAANFYAKDSAFWEKAKPILTRLANGELTLPNNSDIPAKARRQLIVILGRSNDYQSFLEALRLSDLNLQADPNSELAVDLEMRAQLLVSRGLRSLQKQALELLERRAKLRPEPALETQFQQAQLYLALGEWVEGRSLMAEVVSAARTSAEKAGGTSADAYRRFAAYVNAHINALLDHDEVTDAQLWTAAWKRVDPKALQAAILEARALVPKRRPEPDAVVPTLHVPEAIDVLNKAIEDPEVQPAKDAKMALVLPALEGILDLVIKNGTTADADLLKAKILEYDQAVIDADPKLQAARQLLPVQFLAGQGERRKAVDTLKQYWGEAALEIFITASNALLNVDADLKKIEARELSPQFTAEDKEKQKAELMATVSETEAVVQQALAKYQAELATAAESDKPRKSAEVVALLSLLGGYNVNTSRYPEAIAVYGEILALQPKNFIALNNRAMILSGTKTNLPEALQQIEQAIEQVGPRPMLVDSLAMVLLANGKNAEALEAAQQVMLEIPTPVELKADPELAKSWGGYYFHLALMYDAKGNQAEVVKALQEAKSLGFGAGDVSPLERQDWQKLVAKSGLEVN